MATTNLLQWNPTAANQETDPQYLADSQRAGGATDPSLFLSPLANKAFFQWSTYLTALFQAFANKGFTTSDSNLNTLTAQCANFLTTSDFRPNLLAVDYAPSVTFNMAQALGFELELNGNAAIDVVNPQLGDVVVFLLAQDAVGGRTVTWSGNVFSPGTPDPTPNSVSAQIFKADDVGHLLPASPMMSYSGFIVGTPIGNTAPSTGRFTTLATTGLATLAQLTLVAPGGAGQVLTNVGGVFVPQTPLANAARVDTANGSYVRYSDGTLEQWGTVTVPANGTDYNTAAFTFPTPFAAQVSCNVTLLGLPSNSGDPTTPAACQLQTLSLSGGTAYMARVIVAGAGGGHFDNATTLQWIAKGH